MTDAPAPQTSPSPAPAPKKRSLGRRLLRLGAYLVLFLIVVLVALYLFRNTLVRVGVEQGGKYATDQATILQSADLSLIGGSLDLSQLHIGDPPGFKSPQFLTMKNCNVNVDTGSLLSKTIVVNQIDITGLDIYIEQQGLKNNLAVLLDIMKQKSSAANPPPAPAAKSSAPESPGRSLKIKQIRVTGTVHLVGAAPLNLGTIIINDPTNPDGRPMKIADVMVTVLVHVAQNVVGNPQLPPEFKKGLADVGKFVDNLKLGDVANQAGQAVQNVGTQAGQVIQDIGKGLQGLIPGGNKPDTKP